MSESEHDTPQKQGTWFLLPFTCDLPLLHTPDGAIVPLVALCDMLGLPTSPYTAHACNRFRPEGALRRLPFRDDPDSPPRPVWCIREEKVIAWLWSVRSERVSPARREQLHDFLRQSVEIAADQLFTAMLEQYRVPRAEVFDWLLKCEDLLARLQRVADRSVPRLHPSHRAELVALMAQGRTLFEESAERARTVVQEIAQQPIVNIVKVNAEGEVVVIGSMPLLPILASQPLLEQSQDGLARRIRCISESSSPPVDATLVRTGGSHAESRWVGVAQDPPQTELPRVMQGQGTTTNGNTPGIFGIRVCLTNHESSQMTMEAITTIMWN